MIYVGISATTCSIENLVDKKGMRFLIYSIFGEQLK